MPIADNNISEFLSALNRLQGAELVRLLQRITELRLFHPVADGIFSAIGEEDADYPSLMNAANKAVSHGYKVYILPNPKGMRSADFIFVRKGIIRLYDLKTIQGKASVLNRLMESVGQTNHVLLNMATDYPSTALARSIKKYFERNPQALQVLIFKGTKIMSVTRKTLEDRKFVSTFAKLYNK